MSQQLEIVFEQLPPSEMTPAAGELRLRPCTAAARGLALLVLEQGPQTLVQGTGPVRRIVVNPDPTLDDMLTVAFLRRQLAAETLPPGCKAFALYAATIREGLKAADLPLDQALEGIFLAIRSQAGGDLRQPQPRERFLADSALMEQRIVKAAEAGEDPHKTALFAGDPEFNRARTYLARDHEVYRLQDVPRGERWRIYVPDGPPGGAGGLILRKPKSILWKYWAREDPAAPEGPGYLFLGVFEKERMWRFSTDPVRRTPIGSLAAALQTEEDKAGATSDDPWYDGRRHDHTLVGAPLAGTKLTDDQVLRVVRTWTRAVPIRPAKRHVAFRYAGAAAALLGIVLAIVVWPRGTTQPVPPTGGDRGLGLSPEPEDFGPKKGKDIALLIATDHYQHWPRLKNPVLDAEQLAAVLSKEYDFQTEVVKNPGKKEFLAAINKYAAMSFQPGDQFLVFIAGHGDFLPSNKIGFFVAKDSQAKEADPERDSYIMSNGVRDIVERTDCNHVLLMLDVCYGGTLDFDVATDNPDRGDALPPARNLAPAQFVGRTMKHNARRIITSAGKEPVKDGEPGKHSPFARALLHKLTEGGKQGILTTEEIWPYLKRQVDPPPRRMNFRRDNRNGDFLFVRKDVLK